MCAVGFISGETRKKEGKKKKSKKIRSYDFDKNLLWKWRGVGWTEWMLLVQNVARLYEYEYIKSLHT